MQVFLYLLLYRIIKYLNLHILVLNLSRSINIFALCKTKKSPCLPSQEAEIFLPWTPGLGRELVSREVRQRKLQTATGKKETIGLN